MSDRYIDFANSSLGHRLVAAIGLPSPVRLERWQAGRLRPVEGALLLGGGALTTQVQAFANRLTDAIYTYGTETSTWIPGHGPKLKAVMNIFAWLIGIAGYSLITYRLYLRAMSIFVKHNASTITLGISLAPFLLIAAIGCGLMVLQLVSNIILNVMELCGRNSDTDALKDGGNT